MQSLNQTQNLAMTPAMRQSLAVLRMPAAELQTFLARSLLENCLLEQVEGDVEGAEAGEDDDGAWGEEDNEAARDAQETVMDELLPDDSPAWIAREMQGSAGQTYENLAASAVTLQDHLLSQLHLGKYPPALQRLAEYLIGEIDEDGYLRCGCEEAAALLGAKAGEIREAVALIQGFEPPGVGARDLRECLILQLKYGNAPAVSQAGREIQSLAVAIIQDRLPELAAGGTARLAGVLKRPAASVQQAVDLIRRLDPKPGRNYSREDPGYVQPDVTVKETGRDYAVIVNDSPGTRLRISPSYRRMLAEGERLDRQALDFLRENLRSALRLIKAVEERRQTLFRITEAVVALQRDFMAHGPGGLRPLTLREVAQAVGLHESTVSRALAGKYVDTPHGLFSFSALFGPGLGTADGGAASPGRVKRLIGERIAHESAAAPLSDQELASALQKEGIAVSRRTVAKYREEMMIPASGKRRRY